MNLITSEKQWAASDATPTLSAGSLPCRGRVDCDLCHGHLPQFNETQPPSKDGVWRLTSNPMAWGNSKPEVLVLGFSKGPDQIKDIEERSHDDVPFRSGRLNVGKILAHIGLLPQGSKTELRAAVKAAITDTKGRFAWGSLIRCTVERYEATQEKWMATSKMIDPFMESDFGGPVARNCSTRFLGALPAETRLIVMFGLGTRLGYVASAKEAIMAARPGKWHSVNEVAYSDGHITVVHVEHFKARGDLIPQWLGERGHARADYGQQAKDAVMKALS